MGKPGKKAGKGLLPPTNVKRQVGPNDTHLRDQRTVRRLKMYTSKIKRDEKGNIIKGSVLSASDRVERSAARIAPDRRWFGNTRTIGQEQLQKFREEMGAKYRDPYSIIIKQSKLPLSILEEPKESAEMKKEMRFEDTFGDKSRRKRPQLATATIEQMAASVSEKADTYESTKDTRDRALMRKRQEADGERMDKTANQKLFRKGQSNRIWNELYKVVDSADVILYVLDARDPMGTRSPFLEEYMKKEKKYKHFVFVLNKCDLIPLWATARWMQILSKDFPTIAFHASVTHPFGKGNLISLLRQFSRLHNVTNRGNKRTKTPISVGLVGYPNVGKSSIINTIRRKAVCKVAPIPGETKVWQYVAITRSIFVIDCPGIVYDKEGNNDVQAVLKGVVRIERLGSADKSDVVHTVLEIVKEKDMVATYGVPSWRDANDFLEQLARSRGKLLKDGIPDTDSVARSVLYDWQRGKIPWFSAPPFESNQHFRDTMAKPNHAHLKSIEHYNTFNVVDDRIEYENPSEDEEAEEDEEGSITGDDNPEETLASFVKSKEDKAKKTALRQERAKRREDEIATKKKRMEGAQPAEAGGDEDELWAKFMASAK